jgi:protein arginine kinase activator
MPGDEQQGPGAMNCQVCEKQPATFHLTEIGEGGKTVRHLCEECAGRLGLASGNPVPSMLATLFEGSKELAATSTRCPECGISFEEFRAKGRLGCPKDYEVFAKELAPLLEKIHGGVGKHVGRVPAGAGRDTVREDALLRLRRELGRAVREEKYEEAARLRDEIRHAEEALKGAV